MTSRLWRLRSLRDGLEEMLTATIELLGADMGNIQLLDTERDVLTIAVQRGFDREFLEFFREVSTKDDSACGRSLRSGERTVVENVEADELYAPLRDIARRARYLAVQSTPLMDRDGKPLGMISTHWHDIHLPTEYELDRLDLYARQASDFIERCRTEEALEEEHRRLQLALEAGRMGSWEWSAATDKVVWSSGLAVIHGRPPGTLETTFETYQRGIHLDDVEAVRASIARSLETGHDHHVEYRIIWPDASVHWVESRGRVIKNRDGGAIGIAGVCSDITARKIAEDAVRESERRFRTMADSAPVLIWISNTEKRCTWFNRRWLEFVGRTLDRELGDGWAVNVHPDDLDRCVKTYVNALGAREDFSREYRLRRADGEYRWVLDNGVTTWGRDGEFTGYMGSCIDITDRKHVEVDLRTANRVKDDFLATLSHELRTPLNAVLGWAQMLRTGTLRPDAATHAVESLERNARAQVQLVDDLLDMSGIVSGKLSIDQQVIDVATVVAAAIETVRHAAVTKGVSIVVTIEPGEALPVVGDADRIRQIVWNLLSNAVKFTPPGGLVSVALSSRGSEAELVVRDTGEGIAPQFLPFVFERFRQAESGTTRRHGGLGLGLAIVKHLAEAHRGTITAASEGVGKGATFTVRFPIAGNAPITAETHRPPEGAPDLLRGVRVLVVDDDPDARDVLRAILESQAAEVSEAGSAVEALHALQNQAYDALVADIGMPERDGLWLIRAVRDSSHAQRQIPAIALTAYAGLQEREIALDTGYDLHVAKPVDADQLLMAISSALT